MGNDLGDGLRAALNEALREHEAVEEIFAEDTGADDARVYVNGTNTTVVLEYRNGEDGTL